MEEDDLDDRLYQKLNFHDSWLPLHNTKTTDSQYETQAKYCKRIQFFVDNSEIIKNAQLAKEKHIQYCLKGLEGRVLIILRLI